MTYAEFIKEIENNIAKANCNKLNIGEYEEKQKQIYNQIRAEVIDDFTIKLENAIQEDIDDDVINQWDKGTFMGCVKFVAEELKAGVENV